MSEYRQDDRTLGYCPKCGQVLATVFVDAAGWCPTHGRVWAEWVPPAVSDRYGREWAVTDRDHGDENEEDQP